MTFHFGSRSKSELEGVHPKLDKLAWATISASPVNFGVFDGLRTPAQQNALFRRGASTIDGFNRIGKHQRQEDGFGHAIDLVPWIDGRFQWDWDALYVITEVLHVKAIELDVQIRWGGCWRHINPLKGSPENWVAEYVKRKLSAGKRAFNDGPHFELYEVTT